MGTTAQKRKVFGGAGKSLLGVFGLLVAAGVCVLGILAGWAYADDYEPFEAARKYTVKIRTQVSMPFLGDDKKTSTGAGFVVDAKRGWIVTNAHVASRSLSNVTAGFQGGEYVGVRKVYVDPYIDLAVLELPETARSGIASEARLECEAETPVGHPVGAFGHPWRLYFTGTRGIVSGKTAKYKGMIEMIQTDAPINPGNSGGPLISLSTGKVIAINTAQKRNSQGSNFALPISQACLVLDMLRAGRDPSPPNLGVSFLADPEEPRRLIVAKLHDGAAGSGLEEGDEILGIAGEDGNIRNRGQLLHALRARDGSAPLLVRRKGADIVVPVKFKRADRVMERRGLLVGGALFGLDIMEDGFALIPGLVPGKYDLMVHHVEPGSEADAGYMQNMDLVVSVDGDAVGSLDEMYRRVEKARLAGRNVVLKLARLDGVSEGLYSFAESRLPVEDVKWIGPGR